MAIRRAKRDSDFTMISNVGLKDNRLSFKAKGLLSYMLSLPDDWIFYESEIVNHATDGKQSVRTGMKELEKFGYLVKEQKRNSKGKFAKIDWVVSDEPINGDTTTFQPSTTFPSTDNPSTDKRATDNRTLLSTNELSTNKQSTDKDTASPKKSKYGDAENVLLTDEEYKKLKDRFPSDYEERINNLSYYIASKGAKYKSHYMTILAWARKDSNKNKKGSAWESYIN